MRKLWCLKSGQTIYEGKTWEQACRVYVETLFEGLKMMDPDLYCCVGHVDFPMKGRRLFQQMVLEPELVIHRQEDRKEGSDLCLIP